MGRIESEAAMRFKIRTRVLLPFLLCIVFNRSATAQTRPGLSNCLHESGQQIVHDAAWLGHGLESAPGAAIKPHNLAWELPVAASTAALIAWADTPASRRIQSRSLQQDASRWSNVGLGLELGTAALTYGVGCATGQTNSRQTGLLALEAAGVASAMTYVIQKGVNRQRPFQNNGAGEFWEGGTSFSSGHAAASFAFASVVAHRYPHKAWIKWGAYAAAAAVSLSRYPAKQHFLSDILVGSTLGYVTGTYLASPHTGIQ